MMTTTACSSFSSVTSKNTNVEVTASSKTVEAGSNWVVDKTTKLSSLTIGEGATITAPEGYSITMTVDGIGKTIKPGTFKGDVVLSVTKYNEVKYVKENMGVNLTHIFRQALFVDSTGIVENKSVTASVVGGNVTNTDAKDIKITSEEENFNGIYVAGGTYTVNGAKINLTGNGGNDFAGFGAAVMATGKDTTVVVDDADIQTHGAIRPAVIAADGSNLIVKNSKINTENGTLPADYKPNVQLGMMKSVPWMLGLSGNCRATNVLGDNTTATYINSSISSEGWGVLSTDDCNNIKLTAINSNVAITGESGYGAYAIGNAEDSFYGSKITVPDYALIITGGSGIFGASTRTNLDKLNTSLKLGLTSKDLDAIEEKQTTVKSSRFGVMWHGDGSVSVKDGTTFDTGKTTFLVKGASAHIDVDGSKGAQLKSGNGVLLQLMDNDDPGPVMTDGLLLNTGVYKEPTEPAVKDKTHNTAAIDKARDTIANFSNIELKGDLYNSTRGDLVKDMSGKESRKCKNLSINFDNAKITGTISASTAKHEISSIGAEDYKKLGEVTNTANAAVNNGVVVSLTNGSTWIVNGNSYLTGLTIADSSKITAPEGYKVTMTVNGVEKNITAGTYTGNILLKVTPIAN
ncbi:hypothetical protein [Clostridium caldaquaticum]|uniref:hypothetical protein n=1 Tax=Clostridium caldaquaticum TaxID=2940653 RepID=UPI0020777B6D|nr:hypothetical protein [Clostridium caldaquaticum]